MIEIFLKETFPRHYGIDPDMVNVPIERTQRPFTKVDDKACNDAANIRCDLIMTDGVPHNKIVFCDLCCYEEKYIGPNSGQHPEGKRAYARKQMEKSIEMLLSVNVLNQYILTYPEKECLFAYRSYNAIQQPVKAQRRNVEDNMQAMMVTPSSVSGRIVTENNVMNHNFTFVQNKYPAVYNW